MTTYIYLIIHSYLKFQSDEYKKNAQAALEKCISEQGADAGEYRGC